MHHLTGHTALVTGASRGIGEAISRTLASHGARIALHYRSKKEDADRVCGSLSGSGHIIAHADLMDALAVERMVEKVAAAFGKIDILVNNAGIFDLHPLQDLSYDSWQDAWQKTIGTNLVGAANTSYCVIRQMQKKGGGRIINVTSRGAFRGEPEAPAYGASKAGLNALSQSLARALAPEGILVFAVAPGFVRTERIEPLLKGERGRDILSQSPFGRIAEPEEVARTVLFLAAEAPEFLSGCIIDINGASYLRT
ncbi:MAG: SDR family oxidoreductase [Proteobacteria bacterium]|nr:SDR family oxidoreductase [Pseudomonadota bacterium]